MLFTKKNKQKKHACQTLMGGFGIMGMFCPRASSTVSTPTSGLIIGAGSFSAARPERDFTPGIMVITPLSLPSSHPSLSDNPTRQKERANPNLR